MTRVQKVLGVCMASPCADRWSRFRAWKGIDGGVCPACDCGPAKPNLALSIASTIVCLQRMIADEHSGTSPSGAIEVEANGSQLVIKARMAYDLKLVGLGLSLIVVFAVCVLAIARSSLVESVLAGVGLLGGSAFILDRSKIASTLCFTGENLEVTKVRLFTASRRHVRLVTGVEPRVASRGYENGEVSFIHLRVVGGSHLNVLAGQTTEDLAWTLAALLHWWRGAAGPNRG